MKKEFLFFTFLRLCITYHAIFTMDEKPLKNIKFQKFEADCKEYGPGSLKYIVNTHQENKFIQGNDPTEQFIHIQKEIILLQEYKKRNEELEIIIRQENIASMSNITNLLTLVLPILVEQVAIIHNLQQCFIAPLNRNN